VENVFEIDDRPHPTRVMILLISTILLIALLPFSAYLPRLIDIVQVVMIASAVLVCSTSRTTFGIALALGVPAGLFGLIGSFPKMTVASRLEAGFTVMLFFYVVALMIRRIFRTRVVTRETIGLAVSAYMLVGVVWAICYVTLELVYPGSFRFTESSAPSTFWAELYYFSFVTLTTLGYGDVVPTSPMARSLAILEAITGLMFLGILVARLLGRFQADPETGDTDDGS
jgi:hypothetical protein